MPFNPCDICECPDNLAQAALGKDTFRQAVLSLLCLISQGGITPETAAVVNIPAKTIPFGDITAGYLPLTFLDSEGLAREITVWNNTNQDVEISYDGISQGPFIPAGGYRTINFSANGRILSAEDIYLKYLNGVAPTMGQVRIDGFY